MQLTAAQIARLGHGVVTSGAPEVGAMSFVIDSRTTQPGACFVALVSDRDGHDYVPDAFRRGAVIAVVSREVDAGPSGTAVVRVPDPETTLRELGRLARDELSSATVVGITGSAGKTATKDLLRAALGARAAHASPRSYNGYRGIPLTMLGAPGDVDVVIVELGAQFPGDIETFTQLARPQVGVVTHIGLAHAEFLGGREGIAHDKGAMVAALPPDGLAVLNHDCDMTARLVARTPARVMRVGRGAGADVKVSEVSIDADLRVGFRLESPWGRTRVRLQLRGEHHAQNAAMAAVVALDLGTDLETVAAGLAQTAAAPYRMEVSSLPSGTRVINDAYNSSPTSAAAALHSLASLEVPGRRIAVLGEMLELGEHAEGAHRALGTLAAQLGVDLVVVVGSGAAPIASQARRDGVTAVEVADADHAVAVLRREAGPDDAVLVKASRACGLEQVAVSLSSGSTDR